jgi:restriction system protein
MAEITKKRSGELVRGVFQILMDHPDGLPAKEVLRRLEQVVPPTKFEESFYPKHPNIRRYEKIVRFSTIGVVKASWLIKDKGTWLLTDEGRRAYASLGDPEAFMREVNRLYKKWAASQPEEEPEEVDESSQAIATLEEAEEAAWTEIETFLGDMSPYDFQEVVAGPLRGMGYHVDWVSPPGPDKGIDIVAHVDPLGVKGPRIKAQVKRRRDKVAVDGVRGFMAMLGAQTWGCLCLREDLRVRLRKRRVGKKSAASCCWT